MVYSVRKNQIDEYSAFQVLLGLLEMCCEADWWVPSAKYGLPLTAAGDSCRTSRLALASVARVRILILHNMLTHQEVEG